MTHFNNKEKRVQTKCYSWSDEVENSPFNWITQLRSNEKPNSKHICRRLNKIDWQNFRLTPICSCQNAVAAREMLPNGCCKKGVVVVKMLLPKRFFEKVG